MSYQPWFADYGRYGPYGPHFLGTNYWPRRILNQHFGLGIGSDDTITHVGTPLISLGYYRPWKLVNKDVGSNIKIDNDEFKVTLDVQHFTPNEINVTRGDDIVTVEAKHEERHDEHGAISRQFVRRYTLPKDIDVESVKSRLSSDGVLTITALKKSQDRIIPIQYSESNYFQPEQENGTGEMNGYHEDK